LGPRFEEQWRNRFEEFADLRDDDAGIAGWSSTGLEARVRRFLGLWQPGETGQLWLDAGCGAGTYTRILLGHGYRAIGIDYSLPTLRKAIERRLDGAAFTAADVRRLPFAADQFDGILCLGVTQALERSEPALREFARVLKPGGDLWIDALNGWCLVHAFGRLRRRILGNPVRLRYESPRQIKRLCVECGFADVHLDWMPILPGRSYRMQHVLETPAGAWLLEHAPAFGALVSHAFMIQAKKTGAPAGRES
jgi:SAM-dependent methyltransferase